MGGCPFGGNDGPDGRCSVHFGYINLHWIATHLIDIRGLPLVTTTLLAIGIIGKGSWISTILSPQRNRGWSSLLLHFLLLSVLSISPSNPNLFVHPASTFNKFNTFIINKLKAESSSFVKESNKLIQPTNRSRNFVWAFQFVNLRRRN